MNDFVSQMTTGYKKMYAIRRAEKVIQREYAFDLMKTPVHLSIGAEAIAVGVIQGLPQDSKMFGTYRSHALYLGLTEDYTGFFSELYGRKSGSSKGKAGSMHLMNPDKGIIATSAVVGTTIPLAVGYAMAAKIKKENNITAVFFGDGAIEEGVFFESLNFAKLHRLKILFVCEDNELAIHAEPRTRKGYRSIAGLAELFDIPFRSVDGWNYPSVLEATKALYETMSPHSGPTFLHAKYFRSLEHVGIAEDFHFGYRKKPENQHVYDPITNFESSEIAQKLPLKEIQSEINQVIEQAVRLAIQDQPPEASELFTDVL